MYHYSLEVKEEEPLRSLAELGWVGVLGLCRNSSTLAEDERLKYGCCFSTTNSLGLQIASSPGPIRKETDHPRLV